MEETKAGLQLTLDCDGAVNTVFLEFKDISKGNLATPTLCSMLGGSIENLIAIRQIQKKNGVISSFEVDLVKLTQAFEKIEESYRDEREDKQTDGNDSDNQTPRNEDEGCE